jgi:hypothetical protein
MSTPVYDYLQLIKTVLAEIRTANGYQTDLGALVSLEDTQQLDDDGARLVLMQDTLGRSTDPAIRGAGYRLQFAVVAQHPRSGGDTQLRLHRAQSDVIRCLSDLALLSATFKTAGVSLPFPQFEESVMASQVEGMAWVGVAVRYSAHLRPR